MASHIRHQGLIEGDYIETLEGLLFAVKGIHHPEGLTIAYLRYVPDPLGTRERGGHRYRRVYDLEETDSFLRDNYPQYMNPVEDRGLTMQSIPRGRIARTYNPRERLEELLADPGRGPERIISKLVSALAEYGVSLDRLGVSGSVLIGMDTPDSDVDLIGYGMDAGSKIYEALKRLRQEADWVSPYDAETVEDVTRSRWGDTGLDLASLGVIEARKILHGLVDGTDYFVRLVREPEEFEREVSSLPLERITLRATVRESGASINTPCTYGIDECSCRGSHDWPDPSQLVSFRGKFTEQAEVGDRVEAKGTLERVEYGDRTAYRVMLGGRGDYMVPITLLNR